jgi:hypothetical protein
MPMANRLHPAGRNGQVDGASTADEWRAGPWVRSMRRALTAAKGVRYSLGNEQVSWEEQQIFGARVEVRNHDREGLLVRDTSRDAPGQWPPSSRV